MKEKKAVIWLMKQTGRRLPGLVAMTLANTAMALLGVGFALGTRQVIDRAVSGHAEGFRRACGWQLCVVVSMLLCLWIARSLKEHLSAKLERDWKASLLHGLLHGDYAGVSGFHSAELMNRMNNDVRIVDEGLLSILPNLCAMVARLTAAVAVLAMLDMTFTLAMVVLGGFVIVATALLRRKMKALHKEVSDHDGRVSGFFQETLEKLLMVQAMDVSAEMERRADVLLERRYAVQKRRKRLTVAANMAVNCMTYGAGFLALVWCAGRVLQGDMTLGSMTAVTQLVSQLRIPFVGLSGIFPQYVAMTASAERLMELEQIQGQPEPVTIEPEALYASMDALAGEDLSFAYEREQIFADARFRLPKGAFAVVTGPSGIGKSTLLKLLLGIFSPEHGNLYLACGDGKLPLNRSTRRMFAYVPQGNLLISGTLRDNLTIVKPDATEAELNRAVYVSGMDLFLHTLPDGLDTVLGESGMGLSEGQAQRLAIARAVLSGAPVLLLDECTSALDEQTEKLVLTRIRELPERTCIAVTHRPAAVSLCDWTLSVHGGKITAARVETAELSD